MTKTPPFDPCGVVTLLTDFGLTDTYVGAMHGVLHRLAPGLRAIVDLTHGVPAQDVRCGAFHLSTSWSRFPTGSVHVAVVDPGVGSERKILLAVQDGHAFLAPDNGLLNHVLKGTAEVWELNEEAARVGPVSSTFHGRDLFAPAAAALAEGRPIAELATRPVGLDPQPPVLMRDGVCAGQIVSVDRFGNLISDIPAEALGGAPGPWQVHLGAERLQLSSTYASVPTGGLLALIDSAGTIEVAVRDGSAAERLGLGRGTPILVRSDATPQRG